MKHTRLAAVLLPLALMIAQDGMAQTAIIQDTTEFARVLSYSPIPGPQVGRQVCTPVTVVHERQSGDSVGGAVVGGLVGALVGSRFGGGHGKDAATIAGAIGGAVIGENMASASGPTTSTQQQCGMVYEPGPPQGYQVTYDYKGKLYTTTTRMPPGEYLRVRSRVTVE